MNVNPVASLFVQYLYYPTVLVFVVTLIQRRHMQEGFRKRYATLYIGLFLLALWGFSFFLVSYRLSDFLLLLFAGAAGVLAAFRRENVFLFRLTCLKCRKRLQIREVLFDDSNCCPVCRAEGEGSRGGS